MSLSNCISPWRLFKGPERDRLGDRKGIGRFPTSRVIVQQNGAKFKILCAFYHTSINFFHKGAFGCALSYLSKRLTFFSNMAAKSKMAAINRFKNKNSNNSSLNTDKKVKVLAQKASLNVEAMVFNPVHN